MTKKIALDPATPLASSRQEAFVQAHAGGATADEAATTAGFLTPGYGRTLLRRPVLAARVEALKASLAGGGSRDTRWLIDQLLEIAKQALARDDPRGLSIARACFVDAAKLKVRLPTEAPAVPADRAAYFAELDREVSDEEWTRLYGPEAPGGKVGDGGP
ncbi:MAG TPA: hypothetical protein VII63_08240 [Caulobacteraceae bacterium]